MDRWIGKVAIVTGASSGIGEAIAVRLVEEGLKVVGVARRKERLDSLASSLAAKKGQFYAFQADFSKEEDILQCFSWVKQNVGPLHILVNNAGIHRPAEFLDFKTEDVKAMFDLNVLGLSIACREALKVFKENHINGHIININSLAGHWVFDWGVLAMYTASKHAVTALTESLYLELKRLKMGTKVTSISPGTVDTDIMEEEIREKLNKDPNWPALQAKDIADSAIYVLSTPPNCQVDELTIRPIYVKE